MESETTELLTFWRKYETRYPVIARAARDYLTIMGASANVERFFCAEDRGGLGPESIEHLALSQHWLRSPVDPPAAFELALQLYRAELDA
jgi:hypothetical protein